jgi:hypothetical protein
MTKEHSFVAGDYSDRDLYTSSRTRERALNSAIVRAEIRESFEEYLETFDAFYADEIEASNETVEEPVRGKAGVRSLLFNFVVPLHVMAVETDTCRRADEAVKRLREAVNHLCEYSHVETRLIGTSSLETSVTKLSLSITIR